MKTGIVILNYNDSDNTSLILKDIKNYKILDYIIVVDNNSSDDSVKILKKFENDKIKIIKNKENKGYSAGNNIGIKYLMDKNIDNIIISNPDIIVRESEIKNLIDKLNNSDYSVIAPIIKEPLSESKGWKLPTFLSEVISNIPYFRKYEINILKYPDSIYNKELVDVDVVKGCFFIMKKEVIEKCGYFDENTFLYYEEVILAHKLKELNLKTCVDSDTYVIHALSKSVDKSLKSINKFKYLKSSQYYYERYINKMNIFKLFILRILYYIYLFVIEITLLFRR